MLEVRAVEIHTHKHANTHLIHLSQFDCISTLPPARRCCVFRSLLLCLWFSRPPSLYDGPTETHAGDHGGYIGGLSVEPGGWALMPIERLRGRGVGIRVQP